MAPPILGDSARDALADAVAAQGPAWRNAAENIRAGFENVWITPALAVITRLIEQVGDPDDGE